MELEEPVGHRKDGGTESNSRWMDGWMDGGVTFVAIFRGSLFFTCSDKEKGWNKMAQRKEVMITETEGEHNVPTSSDPQSVCVCVPRASRAGMDTSEERDAQPLLRTAVLACPLRGHSLIIAQETFTLRWKVPHQQVWTFCWCFFFTLVSVYVADSS